MSKKEILRVLECILLSLELSDLELNKLFNFKEIDKAKEIIEMLNINEK